MVIKGCTELSLCSAHHPLMGILKLCFTTKTPSAMYCKKTNIIVITNTEYFIFYNEHFQWLFIPCWLLVQCLDGELSALSVTLIHGAHGDQIHLRSCPSS